MLILSCDSSGPAVSAALWNNDQLIAETMIQCGRPHATTLMPMLGDLLDQCDRTTADIDAFACAIGPGSYTGIRIGVSSIKAMAYAAGRPAVGVSTLEAMAWPYAACPGLVVCPAIDARNQRVFAGAWFEGQPILTEANYLAADFVDALSNLSNQPAGFLLVGHRSSAFYLPDGNPVLAKTFLAPVAFAQSRASAIAEIASIRLAEGLEAPPQKLMPQYLSATQAERRLAGNQA